MIAGRASPDTRLAGAPLTPAGAFVARVGPDGLVKWVRSCDSIAVGLTVDSERAYVGFATTTRGVPGEPPGGPDFDARALTLSAFSLRDGAPIWSTQAPAEGPRPYVWGVDLVLTPGGALVAAIDLAEVSSLGDIPLGVDQTSGDLLVSWWDPADGTLRDAKLLAGHESLINEAITPWGDDRIALLGWTQGPMTWAGAPIDSERVGADASGYVVVLDDGAHAWTRRLHGENEATAFTATPTDAGLVVAAGFDGVADFTRGVVGKPGTKHIAFMGLSDDGMTRWERVAAYDSNQARVRDMVAVGPDEVIASISLDRGNAPGGLDLGGLHHPDGPGTSSLLVRVGPEGAIRTIERWSTLDEGTSQPQHEAQPFAMTLHAGSLAIVGRVIGAVRLGEEELTLPGGSIDPCASSNAPGGVLRARVHIDPCKLSSWYHWGGVLRTIPLNDEHDPKDTR